MKRNISSFKPLRSLLLAGLLAAPMLAFNARAVDYHWSPTVVTDGTAYFADPNNWDSVLVPGYTNGVETIRTMINTTAAACIITNDTTLYQLMAGAGGVGGGGDVLITNNAKVTSGWDVIGGFGNIWTGVGFPNGPSTLTIGPGCRFTTGDHLWVGQGTGNTGTVLIDGGILDVHQQLGVGWNGTGGTNYITLQNGGRAFLNTWAAPTLGHPGNNSTGIMNIADNSSYVVVTNNQTSQFSGLTNNNQLIAYGGAGTVTWNYNPVLNITTIHAMAPFINGVTPVIAAQPTNVVLSPGGTASFHVQVVNVPVNYQWFFNGNPLADGSGISGSQTATLTISGVATAQLGSYFVMATNTTHADQFVTSTSVSLSSMGLNLYPVVTVNGVPGSTYAAQYTASLTSPNWITFATITVNSFAPQYVVDTTSPMAVTRFYRVIQQ
jgi:hypothetical protein